MKVKLIVAMDLERGIGKNNDLMWHLPADMKFFKETTQGQIVIMGRRNYDSIPEKYRPLPGRLNVVLTRNTDFKAENCLVFNSLEEALNHFKQEQDRAVFIIGGGQIYREALELDVVDEMDITYVNHRFGADTYFPEFQKDHWSETILFEQTEDLNHKHSFVVKKYLNNKGSSQN